MLASRRDWIAPGLVWLFVAALSALRIPAAVGGYLPDTDDQMRFLQVRGLMNGAPWFDVNQPRLLTPEGGLIHWSRLPDVFLAGLAWPLAPFLGEERALHVAAAIWPLVLFAGACFALALIVRRLGGGPAATAAAIGCFALSATAAQFQPGRIDHHGAQVVLLLTALAALLSPRRTAGSAIVAGLATAAMLAIALEALPYAGGVILAFGLMWIVKGPAEANRLQIFGATVALTGAALYVLDAPGLGASRAVCDAYGAGHAAALIAGGGLLFGLSRFDGALTDWRLRLGGGALAGAATLMVAAIAAPACFGDPYAGLDDEIRYLWLDTIAEARSAFAILAIAPGSVVATLGYAIAALAVGLWLLSRTDDKVRWAGPLIALVLAVLASIYQIRGSIFAHAVAAIPAGLVLGLAIDHWLTARGPQAALRVAAAGLLATPLGWTTLSGPLAPAQVKSETPTALASCATPTAANVVSALPQGAVFTEVDLGPWVLKATPHAAYAAPYHRNPTGIARVIDAFSNPVDEAASTFAELAADYLAYCPGSPAMRLYAKRWPDGFAARMEAGQTPHWLTPLERSDPTAPMALYRIDLRN
ncbi:MAG: hypothetical protein AAFX03_11165 [Pseudomonadota bacterium]